MVAPYTGAWIEIHLFPPVAIMLPVAPYTGAWIEINECCLFVRSKKVAPYTGAWIEILSLSSRRVAQSGRSLHGSVD